MLDLQRINQEAAVALVLIFLLTTFLIIISYEKARRLSPGYPMTMHERYPNLKDKQVLALIIRNRIRFK